MPRNRTKSNLAAPSDQRQTPETSKIIVTVDHALLKAILKQARARLKDAKQELIHTELALEFHPDDDQVYTRFQMAASRLLVISRAIHKLRLRLERLDAWPALHLPDPYQDPGRLHLHR